MIRVELESTPEEIEAFMEVVAEHIRPTVESEAARKLQAAADHLWRCENPKHSHGLLKVKWDTPTPNKLKALEN